MEIYETKVDPKISSRRASHSGLVKECAQHWARQEQKAHPTLNLAKKKKPPRPVILNGANRRIFFRVRFCANASVRAVKDLSTETNYKSQLVRTVVKLERFRFVGRGFNRDITQVERKGLQPLKLTTLLPLDEPT